MKCARSASFVICFAVVGVTLGIGQEWLLSMIFLASYSRHNDISPLEHELRADILEIVRALPGIYLAQLIERTNCPASTVRYHTKVLDREEELQRFSVWGNLRLFPTDIDPELFAYYAAIRDPASARVLRVIEVQQPVTPGCLATQLGRAPSTISHHLARFEDEALISRVRDGESVRVQLRPSAVPGPRRRLLEIE